MRAVATTKVAVCSPNMRMGLGDVKHERNQSTFRLLQALHRPLHKHHRHLLPRADGEVGVVERLGQLGGRARPSRWSAARRGRRCG